MSASSLKQTATYWSPGAEDGFGKKTFTRGERRVRWEDRIEVVTDKKGKEYVSKSRIFSFDSFDLDGYLLLGSSGGADPTVVADAFEIHAVSSIPNLRNMKTLYVAYL